MPQYKVWKDKANSEDHKVIYARDMDAAVEIAAIRYDTESGDYYLVRTGEEMTFYVCSDDDITVYEYTARVEMSPSYYVRFEGEVDDEE